MVGPTGARSAELRNLTVLSGGMGGARFLQGLLHGIATGALPGVAADAEVTVVANTADDLWVHGLKVCPDLDTVMYTLGDGIDPERGWGRREETWSVRTELAAYAVEPTWFGLGDRDIATHLVRTQMLDAGFPLSQVTEALCRRWLTPTLGSRVRLLPMTDDRVETHIAIADDDLERSPSGRRVVHFQEYWVRLRAEVPAETVVVVGLDESTPGPGVVEAITGADLVLLPPSNPVVSVGTILGVPGVREAIVSTPAPVVGISPIIGRSHVRGMAEQLLTSIGVEVSAGAVGRHYGARSGGGVIDGWLVDESDADQLPALHEAGLAAVACPLYMTDHDATAAMAATAVALVCDRPVTGPAALTVLAPDGVPEVRAGDDLATLLLESLVPTDGDIVLVTSKVVSKAEGRSLPGADRNAAIEAELAEPGARVVARRGPTLIVRTSLGLTMAAAGVDGSNVEAGHVLRLPVDPDRSARVLRRAVAERAGVNVAVVVTDTAGRAWRTGQTDIAIGAAGLVVIDDHAGRTDAYGNELAVTAPALADELAGAAELAQGKLSARPFALVRGRPDLVLPRDQDGTGAGALVRGEGEDLFGWGAREAVVRALSGTPADRASFGAPATVEDMAAAVQRVLGVAPQRVEGGLWTVADPALAPLVFAHGWRLDARHDAPGDSPTPPEEGPEKAVIRPQTP